MQTDLAALLETARHPVIQQYRDILAGVTGPGVRLERLGADGIRFTDTEHTTTIRFPKYINLKAAVELAKDDVRDAFVKCGIAEYRYSMKSMNTPSTLDDLTQALDHVKTALQKYHALLLFDRMINGTEVEMAHEAQRETKAEGQVKHSAALTTARAATTGPARQAALSEVLTAKASSNALVWSVPAATTVVVDALPDIRRETKARYETRGRVQARNARIAKKLQSSSSKPKKNKSST